jgi:hypothetical protein
MESGFSLSFSSKNFKKHRYGQRLYKKLQNSWPVLGIRDIFWCESESGLMDPAPDPDLTLGLTPSVILTMQKKKFHIFFLLLIPACTLSSVLKN